MKVSQSRRVRICRAFTLVEVMVASALIGITLLAFMAGFSTSFQGIQLDRENSRAAQILLEKTELLRLYNWSQVTGADTNIYIPTTFTAPFYPDSNNGGGNYFGTGRISQRALTETFPT